MAVTKRVLNISIAVIVLLFFLVIGRMIYLSFTSEAPDMTLVNGSLRPCPQTPNCVSSEALDSSKKTAPINFTIAPDGAWDKLQEGIEKIGGVVAYKEQDYMRATFTSRIFRFVDDMEFHMLPEEKIIHVRSGSRVGKSDLGVNRKNVEKLRKQFALSESAAK